jgi:hypothetical protein
MRRFSLLWPGAALAVTMVDDLVAGPILALGGAFLGPRLGIPLALVVFTMLVTALVWSALAASQELDPATQARIDAMVEQAGRRRYVGRFVRHVGDDHPFATAMVAMIISPVFAVLLARLIHPTQRLHRSSMIAAVSYGAMFALFYATGGSAVGSLL